MDVIDKSAVGNALEPVVSQINNIIGTSVITPSILIASAVLVVLLLIIVSKKLSGKKSRKDTLLLLGLPNSGKTALFYKLKDGKIPATHTSMRENDATFNPVVGEDSKSRSLLHVVDAPGHERLRPRAFHFLPITKAIIYLVDSVDIEDNVSNNAEYLYDLLTNQQVVESGIPVLIACNKLDLSLYKKASIKKKLENSINKIRKTRVAQPDMQGEEDNKSVDLTNDEDEPFDFSKARTDVTFAECTVTGDKIEELLNFAADNLKISL